jgi:hypothetical protein
MSSSGRGSTGFPRRRRGRLPLPAPLSDSGAFGSEALDSVALESAGLGSDDLESPGFESFGVAGAVDPGAVDVGAVEPVPVEAGPVEDVGGADEVVDGDVGAGAEEVPVEGAPAGGGLDGALAGAVSLGALPLLLSRGGPSLVSRPTGTASAFIPVFGFSVPAGSHKPVPIHGFSTFGEVACRALFTVNKPCELPAFSTSYTVPESSVIGTGSALYAVASQNLPFTSIAMGTSEAFPFAPSCRRATARGPISFPPILRSPGLICGRSSCAAARCDRNPRPTSIATRNARRYKILRRKILTRTGCPGDPHAASA